ncbi:hypothetical protein [Dactylosporangium sp. NPDC005555]|uniref:hypothetical protein n=1 Tax=Dactylosporangium sp. NPDC005555 TaxID=3154889 RepID=UPI0033A3AFB2
MTGEIHGASFEDLVAFFRRPVPGGFPVDVVRECVCRSCDGRRFEVRVMDTAQAARRTCLECRRHELIADSVEYWDDDEEVQVRCACLCGEEEFAGAVGFSLREESDDVRWIVVGLRCLSCGRLGVYEAWKIDWGPSNYLLDLA